MIDPSHIGTALPPEEFVIEPGRLRFFAKAIGETDPVYFDCGAAHAAGYRALPAPPSFLFAAALDGDMLLRILLLLGVDVTRVLHAEQAFSYDDMAFAGETVTVEAKVSDIYSKKGGALDFVVLDLVARKGGGGALATMRSVLVVRN